MLGISVDTGKLQQPWPIVIRLLIIIPPPVAARIDDRLGSVIVSRAEFPPMVCSLRLVQVDVRDQIADVIKRFDFLNQFRLSDSLANR